MLEELQQLDQAQWLAGDYDVFAADVDVMGEVRQARMIGVLTFPTFVGIP